MRKKSEPLRAFAPSRETQKEEATPALVPKLRFTHTKARSHEEEEERP